MWSIPKAKWAPGPWHDEPDELRWKDEATGLPCIILRGPGGSLCGYVGVSKRHHFYKRSYDDKAEVPFLLAINLLNISGYDCDVYRQVAVDGTLSIESLISVHGGLTYGGGTLTDKPRGYWWLGFDCGHAGDLMPYLNALRDGAHLQISDEIYRDIDYVKNECAKLAWQFGFIDEWMKGRKS